MPDPIDQLRAQLEGDTIADADDAERFRIEYLGRKSGAITHLFKQISDVPPAERPSFGQRVNALKQEAEQRLENALARFASAAQVAEVDLTLPGRRPPLGSTHPLTQTLGTIVRVFEQFGFSVAEGPEVEDDWHNFTALNFPPDHPARDMQDTFFLRKGEDTEDVVLRTHTSPVQIRVMETQPPPYRIIVPGRVYRNERISYKSFCLFHQVEGLYVDRLPQYGGAGVTMADLKDTLTRFARALFGDDVRMRFRPSFFPFTEPSAEMDIWWPDANQPGGGTWMEILGCGMVDPNVFEAVGVDPERHTGYAFGMGVERIAMLRHDIKDIRLFYQNDLRFLDQF